MGFKVSFISTLLCVWPSRRGRQWDPLRQTAMKNTTRNTEVQKEVLHRDESTNCLYCQSLPTIKESERKRRRRKEHDTFSPKDAVRRRAAKRAAIVTERINYRCSEKQMLKNSDSYLRFLSVHITLRLGWLEDKQKERFCLVFADLHLSISLASLDISEVWHGTLLTAHPPQSSVLHMMQGP